jgi:hypothetical protein
MSNTVWTKKAKETFTGNDTDTPDYGNNPSSGDKQTEDGLKSNTRVNTTMEPPHTPEPTEQMPTDFKQAINYINKKMSQINIYEPFEQIVYFIVGKDKTKTKKDVAVIAKQIVNWLSILLTYIFLLNWWYIFWYNDTLKIEFRHIELPFLTWIIGGPILMIDSILGFFFNYRLLKPCDSATDTNCRMIGSRETTDLLWKWRPVLFTALHLILSNIFLQIKLTEILKYVAYVLAILSVIFTLIRFAKEKWYEIFIKAPMPISIIGLIAIAVCMIIGVIIVAPFLGVILGFILLFLSIFTIFVFNPFSFPSKISEIFTDITNTWPLDPGKSADEYKLPRYLFNNLHAFYISGFVIGLFIYHITQVFKFKTPATVGLGIGINIIAILIPLRRLINIFRDSIKTPDDVPP